MRQRTVTGLPEGLYSDVEKEDANTLWVAVVRDGLYEVNTSTMSASRIAEPEPKAFEHIQRVFRSGSDLYVIADPLSDDCDCSCGAHDFSSPHSALWWLRDFRWEKVAPGLDQAVSSSGEGYRRPWISSHNGLWLASVDSGLWFIPNTGTATDARATPGRPIRQAPE